MEKALPQGRFYTAPGVRLLPAEKEGVVLQSYPLRALKVNSAALGLLDRCRNGLSLEEVGCHSGEQAARIFFPFFDYLCEARFLYWKPAKDVFTPLVSIIVPVYNRVHEIGPCLESLLALNYPEAQREIIVVDDGSKDPTVEKVRHYPVELLVQKENRGQSAARNAGVSAAKGELLAFMDSDCIADPDWLRDLVAYFQDPRVALVGGYVASFYRKTCLDRYEEVKSALNVGAERVICSTKPSDFYVPTCNMLVRKEAYLDVGGLDEHLRIGEDVDFCWKLNKQDHRLLYVPEGKVAHKHRNRFFGCFKRRFDYGTSEPALFARHREVTKRFPWQRGGMLFFLCACLALLMTPWPFLAGAFGVTIWESYRNKKRLEAKMAIRLAYGESLEATFKSYLTFTYFLTMLIVRYHLVAVVVLSCLFPRLIPLALVLVLFPAAAEFLIKRPRLAFPPFLIFFLSEQLFYQAGVFWGCLQSGSFRTYRVRIGRFKSAVPRAAADW